MISYFIDQRKLLFLKKLAIHNNNFLVSLSRLLQNRFYAIGSLYDITTMAASVGQIKSAVWSKFIETVWKFLTSLYRLVYFLQFTEFYRYVCMLCFFIVVCLFCILYFICIFLLLLPTWRIKLMMMMMITIHIITN